MVRLVYDSVVESKGKGTLMVETKKGTRFIKDVLLVPNLKENLISIGQMLEKRIYVLNICKQSEKARNNQSKNGEN